MWFSIFWENLISLPAWAWILWALVVVSAVAFFLVKKKSNAAVPVAVVLLAALVVLFAFALPSIQPEEGASTSAMFLYSPLFWSAVIAVLGIACIVLLLRRQKWTIQMLSTGALCVSLAFVLSCLTLYRMSNGGSITPASMLPIFIFSWIYGPVPGMAAGMLDGLMQLVQGAYVIHPMQFLLDYILPFAVLGLAGLFRKDKQLPLGIAVGCSARFIIHVLSGVLYFADFAPAGQSPLVYSLLYNASYLVPEFIICIVIVMIPRMHNALLRLKHEANPAA